MNVSKFRMFRFVNIEWGSKYPRILSNSNEWQNKKSKSHKYYIRILEISEFPLHPPIHISLKNDAPNRKYGLFPLPPDLSPRLMLKSGVVPKRHINNNNNYMTKKQSEVYGTGRTMAYYPERERESGFFIRFHYADNFYFITGVRGGWMRQHRRGLGQPGAKCCGPTACDCGADCFICQ